MIRFLINTVAVGIILGILGYAAIQEVGAEGGLVSNDCAGWAQALGKEGRVGDSLTMHMLGCDDGPWRTTHYRAVQGTCAKVARQIARTGLWARPRTVAALVEQKAGCTVFEDGTYAPPTS